MRAKQVGAFYKFILIPSVDPWLILLIITGSLGRLTEVPKNNFVLKGATAEFTCCSDVPQPLFWKVKPVALPSIEYIYDVGLVNGFKNNGRFNVTDGSRSGCCRLIISDIRVDDAGTYYCVDHQGIGQQIGWELVIVESFGCQEKNRKAEYMGDNKFGLPEDVLSTVCISNFFGNIPPKPICGWSSGTQIFDNHQYVTETNVTTTLTIQMPARKEFNGDQLFCYLEIDGEASGNQVTTSWKSSHLIINYASFHRRGVSQCSVEELQLDCQPPCNHKPVRFSNGSSYCEITYPSKTHQKLFISFQDTCNNILQRTFIPSTTNLPVENQAHSTVILAVVTTALVSVLIGCVLGGVITAAIIILKRKKCHRRNGSEHEMVPLDPGSNRGISVIAKPGIVINMGDGNTVTINTVYGDQQSSVTMQTEKAPLLRASKTLDLSRTTSKPFAAHENVSVRGVAILGEYLYFAYRGSSKVSVYSANTLGYKKSWQLNELTWPEDVTACSEKNCLYISNNKQTDSECEILKVSPQGCLIKNWNTGINNFGCLSVTHVFNVVLVVYSNRRLVEYQTDGTILREIQLPDALHPIYALKVSPGYYFVSHGFGEDLEHGVSKVDANGQVLETFGNTKGSTNQQLHNPVQLLLNDGSIWVADSQNGRVVVLSPTLEYQATLLSKEEDELSCPLRICIDHNNRRLLLSDNLHNQNHFLRVFNFI